jgi:hypothetical protein
MRYKQIAEQPKTLAPIMALGDETLGTLQKFTKSRSQITNLGIASWPCYPSVLPPFLLWS